MVGDTSERALRALGAFGLTTDDVRAHDAARTARSDEHARALDARLAPGRIAMVSGASGSGKSTLLRTLAGRVRDRGDGVIVAQLPGKEDPRPVIDLLASGPAQIASSLRTLAAAGLADAFIPTTPVGSLSDGQRSRLAVALAMAQADACRGRAPITILIDELASTLDDATGRSLCASLTRWVRASPRIRLIAASARADVSRWLGADESVDLDSIPGASTSRPGPASPLAGPGVNIHPGTLADYRPFADLHYRAGRPATCVRVLVARLEALAEPAGVLVVSMPTLNGAWRSLAWPGEYDNSRPGALTRLNAEVRCISRVIVDPRCRARGVAGALVRAYLARPLTRRTEAIAAMGAACPLFLRAGMREWCPPPARRDVRLIDAIESIEGLRPWMLADVQDTLAIIDAHPRLEKALRTWAREHGPTRALAAGPIRDNIRAAARAIIARPRAYTADQSSMHE